MKEYPTRYYDDSIVKTHIVGVCECGHAKYHHDIANLRPCGDCVCSKYIEEQKMTQIDAIKLMAEIDSKAKKQGFTQ